MISVMAAYNTATQGDMAKPFVTNAVVLPVYFAINTRTVIAIQILTLLWLLTLLT